MNATALYPRTIEPRIAEALQDTPVVLLVGPRQAGKTTLVAGSLSNRGCTT
jgi:predicted AAA+ superfamily ATPase